MQVSLIDSEIILLFVVASYIAWGIGSNDETMMIATSGSSMSVNRLALIGAMATFAGAVFCGQFVEETIGRGILTITATSRIGLIIVIATASWLTVVSYFGWPISTSHSTVGAVIGYGIYAGGLQAINWQNMNRIFLSWIAAPLLGFLLSYSFVKSFVKIGIHTEPSNSKRWLYALLLAALLQEFWQGANNVSNATAFLSVTSEYPSISRIIGGLAIVAGLLTLGRRVLIVSGLRITRLPVFAAFGTQAVIVLLNLVGTVYGLPVSGTHISVACLIGAGLASKSKVDYKMCRNVFLYWFLTLPGAAFFSMLTAYISTLIFP